MPRIFLSPSTQEYNPYVDGGNEEYYMNIITDALIPYLEASGIEYSRNDPSKTVGNSIRMSNSGNYALHLALHSNAAPPSSAGTVKGSQVYYYPSSSEGKRAAEIFANNLKLIYPDPTKVKTVPTTTLAEIIKTKAPTILIELAYHDNPEDAQWIRDNIGGIAENLATSITDFLGIEERIPEGTRIATVATERTALNLRSEASLSGEIIGKIPKGTQIPILGQDGDWYLTYYEGQRGYVNSAYVR